MIRLRRCQPSLWESVLPEEVLRLSEELAQVDALLEDERFFAPFKDKFSCQWGRPTVPIDPIFASCISSFVISWATKLWSRK